MSESAARDTSFDAADTDRIEVAQLLMHAAATGQLDPAEFESRLAKVYAASTYSELSELSADLPATANTRRGSCRPAPSSVLVSIMSAFQRRGRWHVPAKLTTFTLFGGGVIDLRYADFTSPYVAIHVYSIMSRQTILVPPDVRVTSRGVGVLGVFERTIDDGGAPRAPHIAIDGFSLCGEVDIKRRKRGPRTVPEGEW
jgi:hypothetical protein